MSIKFQICVYILAVLSECRMDSGSCIKYIKQYDKNEISVFIDLKQINIDYIL